MTGKPSIVKSNKRVRIAPWIRALAFCGLLAGGGYFLLTRLRLARRGEPAERDRLLKQFDAAERRARKVLASHYDHATLTALVDETRREYEGLIPDVPYIGGRQNLLTWNLEYSAIFLAMYRVLLRRGATSEEVGKVFYEIMEEWYRGYPPVLLGLMGRLRFTRYYSERLRKRASQSQQRRYPGDWVFHYVPGDGKTFDFGVDYVECGILKFFRDHGAEEIMPYVCAVDYPTSKALGMGMVRTSTLAEGASRCDFRFKRGRETREVLPWASNAARGN